MTTVAAGRRAPTARGPATGRSTRGQRVAGYGLLAALAYVPVLLSAPGRVAADTKQYLYLDPDRLLERAPTMWDPNIGFGTVTHQNIGYLFPMGPYYWLLDRLGLPDWVAQRLWLGSILFFAGLGVLYLFRTLSIRGPGAPAAALVFMLSPYSLHYSARISVILLPWAALGWLLALTIRALREGGWRYPAAFAIVVQIVGGVNATALVFAGLAPVLWIAYAWLVAREVDVRRALATTARIGGLTLLTSLWWIAGLSIQGGYGLDILRYTETIETVATAGNSPEIWRGLGYWFFYGRDKLGPWIEASVNYTQWEWLIGVGYLLPVLALACSAWLRWRHRAYFALLALVGMTIAVGAHPYDAPSRLGELLKSLAERSSAALALRSTGRAVPLVALAVAVFLGAGVNALAARWPSAPRRGIVAAVAVGALAVVNLPALWNGSFYGENLQRGEEIPAYWREAAADLDARPSDTRVLEVPGADFASYRWGNLVDPVTPGIMDRPYAARELIPWGSPAAADLLNAFDRRLQEDLLDPDGIAPMAWLFAAGDVVVRNDLQVDRYNLVRPEVLALRLTPPPAGLGEPAVFGDDLGPELQFPLEDETFLALPAGAGAAGPVVIYPVEEPRTIVGAATAERPLLIAGDGEGVVDAASVGLVTRDGVVLYSASYAGDAAALREQLARGATLVVTDTNRKRARRWSTVRENTGNTERADERALRDDPADARLEVFPAAGTDAYSVVEQRGAEVTATAYGNPVSYTPEDRAVRALDGDPTTAWKVGAFDEVIGERIRIDLDEPITTGSVNLVQPLVGPRDRYITRATLRFRSPDGAVSEVPVDLDDASRTEAGQTVEFPARTFDRLEIVVDADNVGTRADYVGVSAVGFGEIRLADEGSEPIVVEEVVRMPEDLLAVAGSASEARPLVLLMTRLRTTPVPPRYDEELTIARAFTLPTARSFGVGGEARLDANAADPLLDELLGYPSLAAGGATAEASSRLPGAITARASQAIDGDPATSWVAAFGDQEGQWIEARAPAPVTFDRLDLVLVADGFHSVPTRVTVEAGGEQRVVDLPAVADGDARNATVEVPVTFAPLTGDRVRVRVDAVRPVTTLDYYSVTDRTMPVAIAELGVPGVRRGAPAGPDIPDTCRNDLVAIDGTPVTVRVRGSRRAAETRGPLDLARCAPAGELAAGPHTLTTADGRRVGIDVDRLALASAPGGAAGAVGPFGAVARDDPAAGPDVDVRDDGRTRVRARVSGAEPGEPFWFVLSQSQNAGWTARADGRDLGAARLVNGYANGWLVTPGPDGTVEVVLTWTPQQRVWWAIAISGIAMLLATALALGLWSARRREPFAGDPAPRWRRSLRGEGPGESLIAAGLFAATGLIVAGVLAGALAAVLVGGAVLVVARWPRWRVVLAAGAPAFLALAGAYVALQQLRYQHPPLFEWPTFFDRVHVLGWLAALFLAADALLAARRGEARAPTGTLGVARPPEETP